MFRCDDQATAIVNGLLVQMTPMLEGAIRDVSTGSNSEFGYTAIFKDPASVPYIKTMLQNMADGSKMPVQTKDWPGDRSPIFICARPGNRDPSMNQFSSACTSEQTPAVRIPDSPWIVLCPTFFRMKEAPERTDCPTEDSRGLMFLPNTMIGNQYTALIRQLAHFYLGPDNLPVEVTNLNQIFSLSADETKRNARSYEFYVASKIYSLLSSCARALG